MSPEAMTPEDQAQQSSNTPTVVQPQSEQDQPAAEPTQTETSVEVLDSDADTKTFSWQASEFIHHQKKTGWYVIFVVVVLALIGVAIFTQQWFSVAVFIAMAATLLVYASKEPRVLSYVLDKDGITIEQKHYPYDHFRSFAVFNDVAWHAIDFDPTQRFMPRLTVYFDSKDLDAIVEILSKHLSHVDRKPDPIERITRNLKF